MHPKSVSNAAPQLGSQYAWGRNALLKFGHVNRSGLDDPAATRPEAARLEHGFGIRLVPRCPQTLKSCPPLRAGPRPNGHIAASCHNQ